MKSHASTTLFAVAVLAATPAPALAQSMTGQPSNGTMAASIDVAVPAYYSIAPRLSLTYNSNSANGFVGVGWTLSGQSFVERASPGRGAPAYRSSDGYLLDGEELVACATLGGTHCTKHQSYKRITRDAAGDRWYVWSKDGVKSTYAPLYVTGAGTFRWALASEQDPNGHVVTYGYWTDAGQNAYLDTIRYNGVVIKLWRDGRSDDISFANGAAIGSTRYRLKTIDVTVGGSRARAYALDYAYSPSTGRALLQKVTRYGSDAQLDGSGAVIAGSALPAQTLTYTSGGASYSSQSSNGSIGGWDTENEYLFGDVNGDGQDDQIIIYRGASDGQAYAQVRHSDGAAFSFVAFNDKIGGWNPATKDFLVDVNGDGKVDLVRIWQHPSGNAYAQVNLSDGNGFPSQSANGSIGGWQDTTRDLFADVNGDGKADLVRIWQHPSGDAYAQINLSDGNGFPSQSANGSVGGWAASSKEYLADINGDGRADLVRIWQHPSGDAYAQVNLSDGAGFPSVSANGSVGGWNPSLQDHLADVNGDGKTDLIRIYQNGTSAFAQVNLSVGHGFAGASSNGPIGGWDPDTTHDFFVDVNGDKRADLVRIYKHGSDGAYAQVRLFSGVGYPSDAFNGYIGGWDPTRIRDGFADVNGDGKADLVRIYNNGSGLFDAFAQVNLSPGDLSPDLLASYRNGLGGTVSISYVPSSFWDNSYLPGGTVIPTVASITTADGRGSSSTASYTYFGGLWSDELRDFLGFRYERSVIDAQGTMQETYRSQSLSNFGAPVDIYLKDGHSNTYHHIHNTYSENNSTLPYTAPLTIIQTYVFNQTANANEIRSEYAYDVYGNLTQSIDYGYYSEWFDERTTANSYAYNTDSYIVGLKSASVSYAGAQASGTITEAVRYDYDSASASTTPPTRGNLTRIEVWDSKTNSYVSTSTTEFDGYGNVLHMTDSRGQTTATDYDPTYHQFAIRVTDPLGHATAADWNYALARPVKVTDANGGITQTIYDALGQQTSVTDPAGQQTRWDYISTGDPTVQRVRVTRPDGSSDGLWSETYYDGLGRTYKLVKEGPSHGVTYMRETAYGDATERAQQTSLWHVSLESPRWVAYGYDGLGRLTSTTLPDGRSSTIAYTNNFYGKTNVVNTDELGHQTSAFYDARGHELQVYETNGTAQYLTSYQYDVSGRVVQKLDARNNATSYAYDSLGHKIAMTDPDMGTLTYTYDSGGMLVGERDAKGQIIGFGYDALGRKIAKYVNGALHTTWRYDEPGHGASTGKLTSVAYPSGSDSFSWNQLGLAASVTRTIGGVPRTIATSYDALARPSIVTYPDGERVTCSYNAGGELSALASSTGINYVTAMAWNPAGQITSMSYGNGTTTAYGYNADRAWLTTASVKKTGGTSLYDASYQYDVRGLVITATQDTKPTARTYNYAYDELGRLVSVGGALGQTFSYDEVGDITSNSLLGSYRYDDPRHPHAVTAAGPALTYAYDDNGNRSTSSTDAFAWDAEDHLTAVTRGGATTSFGYDADGNRVAKTQGSNTTLYFSTMVEQVNGGDVQYYYAGPVLVARRELQTGTRSWYHADRLGSIRLMTDSHGAKLNDYDYQPFGALAQSTAAVSNERGFTGQVSDAEDGLVYMRARHYDPQLGSFLSPDSLVADSGNPQDDNAYSYSANNPINNIDPTGHTPIGGGGSLGGSAFGPIGNLLPPPSSDQGHFNDDARRNQRRQASRQARNERAGVDERNQDTAAAAKVRTLNGVAGHDSAVIRLPENVTIKSDDLTFSSSAGWTRTIVLSDDSIIVVHLTTPNYDARVKKDSYGHSLFELGGAFFRTTIQSPGQNKLDLAALLLHPDMRSSLSSDLQTIDYEIRGNSATTSTYPYLKYVAPLTIPLFPPLGWALTYYANPAGFRRGARNAGFVTVGAFVTEQPEVELLAILAFVEGYYKY